MGAEGTGEPVGENAGGVLSERHRGWVHAARGEVCGKRVRVQSVAVFELLRLPVLKYVRDLLW